MRAVTLIGLETDPSRNIASPDAALPKWRVNDSFFWMTCSTAASTCFPVVALSSASAASSHRPRGWANDKGEPAAKARAVPRNVRRFIAPNPPGLPSRARAQTSSSRDLRHSDGPQDAFDDGVEEPGVGHHPEVEDG